MKPERSLVRIGCLPMQVREGLGPLDDLGRGLQPDDHLDELHRRHRREEVQPQHPFGAPRGGRQLRDRDRRRVGRDQRVLPQHLVELREDRGLDVVVLDDRLDHQLTAGQRVQLRRPADAVTQLGYIRRRELAGGQRAIQRRVQALTRVHEPRRVGLIEHHGDRGARRRLRDAGPHEPCANDADLTH